MEMTEGTGPPAHVLSIEGMMCQQSCGTTVENALRGVPGVSRAEASFRDANARVWGDVDVTLLIDAVECVGFGAEVGENTPPVAPEPPSLKATREFRVQGLRTVADARRVEQAALAVGCASARANVAAGRLLCSLDGPARDVEKTLTEAGYACESIQTDAGDGALLLKVEGMSCAACSSKVEKALSNLPGVLRADVSVATHRARVVFKPGEGDKAEATMAVKECGFRCSLAKRGESGAAAATREVAGWWRSLKVALMLTLPIFIAKWGAAVGPGTDFWRNGIACHGMFTTEALVASVCGLAVQVFVGGRFYRNAYVQFESCSWGMDALVVIATSTVVTYSFYSLIDCCAYNGTHQHLLFDTAAMLLLFITLGKFLESRAKQRTGDAVAALLALRPAVATLLPSVELRDMAAKLSRLEPTADASALELKFRELAAACQAGDVRADACEIGDVARVSTGEAVPVDGRVVLVEGGGSARLDESALTGEAKPAKRARGARVFASSRNCGRSCYIRVEAVGGDSCVAQIARLVEDAQLDKAPVQAYADRIASVFAPCVVALGITTFLAWYIAAETGNVPESWLDERDTFLFALLFGVSVVVVACPCALGLATPTAVMVGTGVGANLGVLAKGGAALEHAAAAKVVVFDKTGTLTQGKPRVVGCDLRNAPKAWGDDDLVKVAASCEQHSAHPLAGALRRAAISRGLKLLRVDDARDVEGLGAQANVGDLGASVAVGSSKFLHSLGVDVVESDLTTQWRHEAATVVHVAFDRRFAGSIAIADAPRPEAALVIAWLQRQSVDVWMCTGDVSQTADAVAATIGLARNRVRSSQLPRDKRDLVTELQATGDVVVFVGDGVNDAPALAQADVGVALGAGSGVAVEAADIVLIGDDLRGVATALDLARHTYRRIRLNFAWATCYNLVLVPAAAGAFYPATQQRLPPAAAAACMVFSSVSVVLSSLALRLYRPPDLAAAAKERRCRRWFGRAAPCDEEREGFLARKSGSADIV